MNIEYLSSCKDIIRFNVLVGARPDYIKQLIDLLALDDCRQIIDIQLNNKLFDYYHSLCCDIGDSNYSNGESQ